VACDNWGGCQVTDRCGLIAHLVQIKALIQNGSSQLALGMLNELHRGILKRMERRTEAKPAGPRMFKLMDGPAIEWAIIEPFNAIAQRNHGQNLDTLHSRGGLSVKEALAVLTGKRWDAYRNLSPDAAIQELAVVIGQLKQQREMP